MTVWIDTSNLSTTAELLVAALREMKNDQRVQFLAEPSYGEVVVQRMRVALSRSRERNRLAGKPIDEFTLKHTVYPFTKEGKRFDAVVLWTEKHRHHIARQILDDLMERDS